MTSQTIAMLAVIVVLASGFAYYYVSSSSQTSSLKEAGRTVCSQAASIAALSVRLISNMSFTLQSQVQADNSLIQTLNSTRPAGYAGMIATLNGGVAQDSALVAYYGSLVSTSNVIGVASASNVCLEFNQ